MEMTTSQKKLDSKQVENPSSGKGDGETKRFFSPTRRASEIISGVEKLEGQVADQEKRWGAFVSLRGRWDEATRIQRTIVASTQELGNTQKEAETLRQVLEKLKGKDREQQREVLASQKEFLQKYGDMQALVQKPETKFQKKWFAEQSERMERYKVAREFLSQEKREFVETTVHTFDLFGAKIDIDGFYHSLSSYEINIRERRDLVKNGDKARYLLNLYEKEEKSYESQDERPITEQRFTLKEDVLLSMATNYPDLYNIKMRDTKDHGTVFWLNRAINSENRSRKDKKQYIVDLKGRVDQTHGDAKPQLQDLCKIGEGINEHVSQQKDLRSSVRMLEKVIADTEYYQNGDRERIEEDYKEFIKNYGISREEVKGNKSKETMEKQLCGFKEAHDLYQALIDGKKNNVSNEDMKVNMDDKINKAKIRKEAVKCYLLAIEKEDRGPMHEYMMRMEKEKMKEVMNVYEFKNIISLFKLLKEEKSCYAKIQELRPSYQKEAAESTQRTEAAEREIYSKQPGAKEGYQKLVMDLAKDWCQDFKKLVRSDLLFEKIIDLCESWQNEFSNALEKLVSQEEERVASKQGEIEDLQISLQGLRVESSNDMNTFIQENRRNLAKADMAQETESQVKQRGIEGWLEQGSTLLEKVGRGQQETWSETEQTRVMKSESHFSHQLFGDRDQKVGEKQDAIDAWLKQGQTLLGSEIEETQTELKKQIDRLKTTPDVSAPIVSEVRLSYLETLIHLSQKNIQRTFMTRYHDTAIKATIHVMETLGTYLGNLYRDQNGNLVAGSNPDVQPGSQLKKVDWDESGRVIVDGKLQKDYAIAYLSLNRIVLGIKAGGFAAHTPMFLGGNEDLSHLLASSKEMNIRETTEAREIEQETQGKLRMGNVMKDTVDHLMKPKERPKMPKIDYEMHFRRIEVAFGSHAKDKEKTATGSRYVPLERDSRMDKSRAEMKGFVVVDLDAFQRFGRLDHRSTPTDIKGCLIHYCQFLEAIGKKPNQKDFLYSESSDIFVAEFQAYLHRTFPLAEVEDLSKKFIDFGDSSS